MSRTEPKRTIRPWVGRSYAHVVMPVPHLTDEVRERATTALAADGWESVPDDEVDALDDRSPSLFHRWRHPQGGVLLLVVLTWYPLTFTIAPKGRPNPRARRAVRRVVQTALAADGHELPDGDLDRVVKASAERWERVLEAMHVVDENRRWLECRECRTCGAWSGYGVLHCKGCARRFAPADDADRDERGRQAAEATAGAERTLRGLGRGEGLFPGWPTPRPDPVSTGGVRTIGAGATG